MIISLSIVIPTIGRIEELKSLLDSIIYSNLEIKYEVLVIDQNPSSFLREIVEVYSEKLPINFINVSFKGLSRAKNYGVKLAKGNVVCFPDDDSEFLKDTINIALNYLKKTSADCIFGRVIDKYTGEDVVTKFKRKSQYLSIDDFEGCFVEATMFAYTDLIKKYNYDENMGAGTIHGAEEGYDLVYRLLKDSKLLYYTPEIMLYHPKKISTKTTCEEISRAFYYSCGLGYLCHKHGLKRKYYKRVMALVFAIVVTSIIKRKETKYYEAQFMGLKLGYGYI